MELKNASQSLSPQRKKTVVEAFLMIREFAIQQQFQSEVPLRTCSCLIWHAIFHMWLSFPVPQWVSLHPGNPAPGLWQYSWANVLTIVLRSEGSGVVRDQPGYLGVDAAIGIAADWWCRTDEAALLLSSTGHVLFASTISFTQVWGHSLLSESVLILCHHHSSSSSPSSSPRTNEKWAEMFLFALKWSWREGLLSCRVLCCSDPWFILSYLRRLSLSGISSVIEFDMTPQAVVAAEMKALISPFPLFSSSLLAGRARGFFLFADSTTAYLVFLSHPPYFGTVGPSTVSWSA